MSMKIRPGIYRQNNGVAVLVFKDNMNRLYSLCINNGTDCNAHLLDVTRIAGYIEAVRYKECLLDKDILGMLLKHYEKK